MEMNGPIPPRTMNLIPWSQRTLVFGRSLDEMPVLLERMQGTPTRIAALLAQQPGGIPDPQLEGKWSVTEHIAHLITLQDRFEGRADDFEQRRTDLCDINLTDQDRLLRGHKTRSLGDVLEEFRLKRAAFIRRMSGFPRAAVEHLAFHPCQKRPMRPVDMLLWIAEHDDHHIASIQALLHPPDAFAAGHSV